MPAEEYPSDAQVDFLIGIFVQHTWTRTGSWRAGMEVAVLVVGFAARKRAIPAWSWRRTAADATVDRAAEITVSGGAT